METERNTAVVEATIRLGSGERVVVTGTEATLGDTIIAAGEGGGLRFVRGVRNSGSSLARAPPPKRDRVG